MICMRDVTIGLILCLASTACGTTYFVDNVIGLDDGTYNGRWEAALPSISSGPFKTIQHAEDEATAGDIIYIKRTGTSYDGFVVEKDDLVFIGYNTLNKSLGDEVWSDLEDGGGVPAEYDEIDNYDEVNDDYNGLPVSSVSNSPIISESGGIGAKVLADGVVIKNLWFTECNQGIWIIGADHVMCKNIYIWSIGDPDTSYDGFSVIVDPLKDPEDGEILDASTDAYISNVAVYNGGQQAFTIRDGSNDATLINCQAYCDTDKQPATKVGGVFVPDTNGPASVSATHYYVNVTDANGVEIYDCTIGRYPDPVKGNDSSTGLPYMPRHEGHGYCLVGTLPDGGVTDCLVDGCVAVNIGQPIEVRNSPVNGNVFNEIVSRQIAADERDSTTDGGSTDVGCITLEGGTYGNTFTRIVLENSDAAVAFFGKTAEGPNATLAGNSNIFVNCDFESEIGIALSDYTDELGSTLNGDLKDGCQQLVEDNVFWHCNFIADPNAALDTCLFESSRDASGNYLLSCVVYGFDYFSKGSQYYRNVSETPYNIPGTSRFTFNNCIFNQNAAGFWLETNPGGGSTTQFDEDDLGDDNIVDGVGIDQGFDGDWNNDGFVNSTDLDIAGDVNALVTIFHPFPDDDLDDSNVRTDGSPDIGTQEY